MGKVTMLTLWYNFIPCQGIGNYANIMIYFIPCQGKGNYANIMI